MLLHEVEYAARERKYGKSEHAIDYDPPIPGTVDSSFNSLAAHLKLKIDERRRARRRHDQ